MKYFLYVFFLMVGLSGVQAQTKQLNLASDVWPPFTDVLGEKSVAEDLVSEALHRLNIQPKTSIMEFGDVMDGIRSGEIDGSAALWKSPEREAYLLFSEPYLTNQLVLVGRKGANVTAIDLSELRGKSVAIVGAYDYGEQVETAEGINFVEGANDQENLVKLLNGEVDYMLVDALLIEYLMEVEGEKATSLLAVGYAPIIKRSLHFAIRKDVPSANGIIDQFNREVKAMTKDGTYNKILQLNWIAADVDGDGQVELVLRGDKAGTSAPRSAYSVAANKNTAQGNGRYYIDGNIYNGWNTVPDSYKQPGVKEEDLNFSVLKLNF